MTRVIYLDFDGVLHPHDVRRHPMRGIYVRSPGGHELFEYAPLLVQLVLGHDDVAVVLSTSWVPAIGFDRAKARLPELLRRRVVGATFHSKFMRGEQFKELPRAVQVLEDAARRRPKRWIALDDDPMDWPVQFESRLLRTHPVNGISEPAILEAIEAWLSS